MRDGKRHEGVVRLEKGQVVVKEKGGSEVRVELGAVREARFVEDGEGVTRATKSGGEPKAADKGKAKRLAGLRAEYFAGYELKDLRLVRVDPKLETWWPLEGSPDPSVPASFSARWTGQIEAKYTETYTFQAGFDSGGRLWIDNRLLIDHWKESGTFSAKMEMKAGRKYDIKVEFRKGQWGGNVRLYWSSNSQRQEAVPAEALTPPAGTVPPTVAVSAPAHGEVALTTSPIMLEAEASDPGGSVKKVEFIADGNLVGMTESAPWRVEWKNPWQGYHKVTAKATDDGGVSAMSEASYIAVAGNASGSLPRPWLEMPVGRLGTLGTTAYANGAVVLSSTRGDLWGEQDSFQYVFQPLNGDGTIAARIASVEPGKGNGNGVAAGLLIRETLAPERAKVVFLGVRPDDGVVLSRRENIWEDRKELVEEGNTPCYLKLARHGRRFLTYRSRDGIKWELTGQRNVEMPPNVFVGLAIVSPEGDNAKAVFDHLAMTTGGPVMESTVKGVTLRSGTTIVGDLWSMDETSVKMGSRRGEVVIPTSLVARILIKPLTKEAVEKLQAGRTGVILNNGDFCDGTVTFKDGAVRVNSVLFGMRQFNTWEETVAAILHDVEETPWRYEVRCGDGSVFRAKVVVVESDKLRITEASGVGSSIPSGDVTSIRCGN
jgi:hypothetical protein